MTEAEPASWTNSWGWATFRDGFDQLPILEAWIDQAHSFGEVETTRRWLNCLASTMVRGHRRMLNEQVEDRPRATAFLRRASELCRRYHGRIDAKRIEVLMGQPAHPRETPR